MEGAVQIKTILSSHIYYHGTSSSSAASIRKYGFRVSRKCRGATDALTRVSGLQDSDAAVNHYIMTKKAAAFYARVAKDEGKKAEIVVLVLPPKINKENDREARFPGEEYKVAQDIRRRYILPAKREDLTKDQVKKIVKAFPSLKNIKSKGRQVVKEYLEKKIQRCRNSQEASIERASSILSEERKRSLRDMENLAASGVDFKKLKPGQIITIQVNI